MESAYEYLAPPDENTAHSDADSHARRRRHADREHLAGVLG